MPAELTATLPLRLTSAAIGSVTKDGQVLSVCPVGKLVMTEFKGEMGSNLTLIILFSLTNNNLNQIKLFLLIYLEIELVLMPRVLVLALVEMGLDTIRVGACTCRDDVGKSSVGADASLRCLDVSSVGADDFCVDANDYTVKERPRLGFLQPKDA